MAIAWADIVDRFRPGDALTPLVGVSELRVDSIDDEQICIRQRLWRACVTRSDLATANRILDEAPEGTTAVELSELIRVHYTGGPDVITECTRIPNLAAVILSSMGAVQGEPAP